MNEHTAKECIEETFTFTEIGLACMYADVTDSKYHEMVAYLVDYRRIDRATAEENNNERACQKEG